MHIFPLILNVIELSGKITIVYLNSKIADFFITVDNPFKDKSEVGQRFRKNIGCCCPFPNKKRNRFCFFQTK